jgi:hypothetical protein
LNTDSKGANSMKPRLRFFIFLVTYSMVVLLASCGNKQKVERGKYEFYYFPNTNVYYDVAAGQYIYSLDSATTWNAINEESKEPPATLGAKQVIYSDTKDVWKANAQHRQQYKGAIYNLMQDDDSAMEAASDASERKVAVKKPPLKKAEEKPKKKGLARFFNNLFGKKEKKQ